MPSHYTVPNPPGIDEAYDGEFVTTGKVDGTSYMIRKLNGRYFGMIPGNDVENVNIVEHSTVMTAGKASREHAENAIRSIAKHLPTQNGKS